MSSTAAATERVDRSATAADSPGPADSGDSTATASATDSTGPAAPTGDGGVLRRALYWLRVGTYSLASLLALSLLAVGTVAVIAEVKGTWHWAIHLESTISYMGVLIGAIIALLVPLLLVSLFARMVYDV